VSAACHHCGAVTTRKDGATAERCGYCNAALPTHCGTCGRRLRRHSFKELRVGPERVEWHGHAVSCARNMTGAPNASAKQVAEGKRVTGADAQGCVY
jgi:hypothetical protein